MKKIILLILISAFAFKSKAQWSTSGSNIYYNTGNVGIGTSSPLSALEIMKPNTLAKLSMSSTGSIAGTITGTMEPKFNGASNTGFFITTNSVFPVVLNNIFRVTTSGVTIGTSTGYSLTVDGKIGAREVIVTTTTPWPDYVFSDNYKLISLADLSLYIHKHQHLPELPSAKEVEQTGQDIAKINMLLLKKVEELTLYVIDQDKKLRALHAEIEALK
jgi:hypothetical protein